MSNSQNRPGISPEDVLKQIDYENIKNRLNFDTEYCSIVIHTGWK